MVDERLARVVEGQVNALGGLLNRAESLAVRLGAARPEERDQFQHGGEFLAAVRAVRRGSPLDYRLKFSNALAWGGEQDPKDGGFALGPAQLATLAPVIGEGSLLSYLKPVFVRSNLVTVALDEEPEWSASGVAAAVTAEGGAITASKPTLKQVRVALFKVAALVHVSDEMDSDTDGSYGEYVWRRAGSKIRGKVEALLLRGTGLDEPLGLLNAPALVTQSKESGQAAATITAANVGRMVGRLLPGGFPGSFWVCHSSALTQLAGLGAIFDGSKLLGRPLVISEACNVLGQAGDLLLVDPAGWLYAVEGPRNSATVAFGFDQNLRSFRAVLRIGAAPLLSAAVARRTGTDTLSHVVQLEARS